MPAFLRPLPLLRLSLIVMLALAGCSKKNEILPGERIPIRAEVEPVPGAAAKHPLSVPPPVMNAEWTHRNGAASGRLIDPAFRPVPQLIWSVDIGAGDAKRTRILTAPIVAGGLVYAIDASGQLTAVTTGGQVAWRKSLVPEGQLADSGLGGGLAEDGGVLFVTTGFGEVFAISPTNGGTIWKRTFDAPIRAAPVAQNGRVVAVMRDDTAVALDARTGQTLWEVQGTGGPGLLGGASPASTGQLVVIPFASGEVLGVLARNGLAVWGTAVTGGRRDLVRSSITDISGDPVIDGGKVYASNQAGRTVRLDAQDRRARLDDPGRLLRAGVAGRGLGLPALRRRGAGARRCHDGRAALAGEPAALLPLQGAFRPRQAERGDPLLRPDPRRRPALGRECRGLAQGVQPGERRPPGRGAAAGRRRRGAGAGRAG